MKSRITLLLSLALTAAAQAAPSNIGEGDSYAWAANIGWLELIPHRPAPGDGIIVTDTHLSGFAWSDSTGWINFGDGTPGDGIRYGNTDGSDSGVNHDSAGNLSGLAWSANLGWINFGWAVPGDPNRPHFNLLNGVFTGYAWSSNAGWINLNTGLLKTDNICRPDTDADGLADAWEYEMTSLPRGGDEGAPELITLTATGDADGDGATDLDEYITGTNPVNAADKFDILAMAPTEGGTSLTWKSNPARIYRIGQSRDLERWAWGSYFAPDFGPTITADAQHLTDNRRFFRVEALLPLRKP